MHLCLNRIFCSVTSVPCFDLEMFLQVMEKYGITIAPLVPPIVLALAKHPLVDKFNLSKPRTITSGAAPLGADLGIVGTGKTMLSRAFAQAEHAGLHLITYTVYTFPAHPVDSTTVEAHA